MKCSNAYYKGVLSQIVRSHPNSLRAKVAAEALEYGEDIEGFFHYLSMYGCQSGMIGSLIYYRDTHAFYDAHYEEIEELRFQLEDDFGEPLQPKGDLKNWYAWMAFEETARRITKYY